MKRLLASVAGGFVIGYAAMRALDAARDLDRPAPSAEKNPRAYGRERRRLMVAGIARSLATLGWTAFTVAPALRGKGDAAESRIRRAGLMTAALVGSWLLDLPTDYVEDHVLERRYGMSKQGPSAWLVDRAKGLGVSVAVTVPLVELFVELMRRSPRRWPLVVTGATIPLLVLANLIAPTFIMPLFNKFEPLTGEIEERLRALARRYDVGDAQILRVDMSRQTEKANAYVTGLFGTHRIVVGDTLLEHFTGDEIEFVVAHELGHYVRRDVWRGVALGTVATWIVLLAGRSLARNGKESETSLDALARLMFFASVTGTLVGPVIAWASRSREWAADRFALAATSAPQWGVAAFSRLRDRNLAEDEQPLWMELLFSSHPSLKARIRELQAAG